MPLVIRPGRPDEAELLSDLAVRSKALWGYSDELLASFRSELTLIPDDVAARRTLVAERDGVVLGFVTVEGDAPVGELGMLFVAPEATGAGIGSVLFRRALATARDLGFRTLTIESDPNAEPFYRAMGAVGVGDVESGSVPGRTLPLMEIDTAPRAAPTEPAT
ncbi:GNAT family N-acetyltransferase [Nocardia farcinica]|uniref:Putative acetyltransferase n=1 Tax=Nocardia farcinica (strain IFM 10152) TaxID=247156 RepID=Q5YUF9_NOCFA|nr:GNAT family N-acetyltransferase [Nocardia farcinica]MBF6234864.1 GNAT family N-acetyltransferase [Nocardia farcinica]MBF6363938.1 GNAT family N-acetyltransferase [Nocardia farcinica]MBF6387777.1 GNAT family N-acetyltransferase [Nocardia farcinica]BAD58182.1 putative acetyltransferase [Nocardia farcinica IFM 10152]